jgi:hypothetical protein
MPLERDERGHSRFHGCSNIRDFELLGKLGEGTFGFVILFLYQTPRSKLIRFCISQGSLQGAFQKTELCRGSEKNPDAQREGRGKIISTEAKLLSWRF